MTTSFSDDPKERSRVINAVQKIERDLYLFASLTQTIGLRDAYLLVFGIDDPSLDENSEEFQEEIRQIRRRYGMRDTSIENV